MRKSQSEPQPRLQSKTAKGRPLCCHHQALEAVGVCPTHATALEGWPCPRTAAIPDPGNETQQLQCKSQTDLSSWVSLGDFALLTRRAGNGDIGLFNFCGRILHSSQTHSGKELRSQAARRITDTRLQVWHHSGAKTSLAHFISVSPSCAPSTP